MAENTVRKNMPTSPVVERTGHLAIAVVKICSVRGGTCWPPYEQPIFSLALAARTHSPEGMMFHMSATKVVLQAPQNLEWCSFGSQMSSITPGSSVMIGMLTYTDLMNAIAP